MPDREEGKMVLTDYGWGLESKMPTRKDLFWIPEGTKQVYTWDGDGWYRIKPPERPAHNGKDLAHG
jgi:hypothetical protein